MFWWTKTILIFFREWEKLDEINTIPFRESKKWSDNYWSIDFLFPRRVKTPGIIDLNILDQAKSHKRKSSEEMESFLPEQVWTPGIYGSDNHDDLPAICYPRVLIILEVLSWINRTFLTMNICKFIFGKEISCVLILKRIVVCNNV